MPSLPEPGDHITTHPGTPGCSPHVTYLVADTTHGLYELNYQPSSPEYWDWAAAVPPHCIATVTRFTPTGPVQWAAPTRRQED